MMAPLMHGRIYPETKSSSLLRHELRILVDPQTITSGTTRPLLDLDVLRNYLRDIPGQPCRITLLAPAQKPNEHIAAYEIMRRLGGEVLPFASILLPQAVEAFGADGQEYPEFVALISTALAADADVVVADPPRGVSLAEVSGKFHISLEDWQKVKNSCEVFVRGHEVPWSFSHPAWGCPWTPFYSITEPDLQLMELHHRAANAQVDSITVEDLRSLAFNRHSNLCYSRDKLLFYV